MLSSKPKTGTLWKAYTLGTTDEEAAAAFVTRYGHEPRSVWRDGSCIHAGPITKVEHDGTLGQHGAL